MFTSLIGVLIAVIVCCSATNLPSQVRIALAGTDSSGNSNGMSISWSTETKPITSTVKYGKVSTQYDLQSIGKSVSYWETYHSHVILSELEPNTKYYYIVGDDTDGWSKEYSFNSAPLTSQLRGNFSFAVFADLGAVNGDPTNVYIDSIKNDVDLVWHGGDVGYADDSFLHKDCVFDFCYENAFDTYLQNVESWTSQLPYMVCVGNHEADCHDPACLTDKDKREQLSNFTAYNYRFRMPSEESGGIMNMHYSFNYGPVHFISIDTETGYPGAAEETRYVLPCGGFGDQLTWLENDLIKANQNRAERPWIFVQGHHPMYEGGSINADFQAAMEDLFYKYGVDIYFSGHVHSYERDYPVYKGVPETSYNNPRATTYLMIGGAGNDEMRGIQLDRSKDPSPHEGKGLTKWYASDEDGAWTAVTDKDNHVGVGKVKIVDDSTLEFEYIRTLNQEKYDSFTLVRDHSIYAKKFA